jgi:hypothetical protein
MTAQWHNVSAVLRTIEQVFESTSFGNFRFQLFLGLRKKVDGDLETEQVDGKELQKVLSLVLPVHCQKLLLNVQSFGENRVVLKTTSPPFASLCAASCNKLAKFFLISSAISTFTRERGGSFSVSL